MTSRLLGLHSGAAVRVAMRAKSCLSAAAFDAAYYAHFLIHLLPASKKTHPQFSTTDELENGILVTSVVGTNSIREEEQSI